MECRAPGSLLILLWLATLTLCLDLNEQPPAPAFAFPVGISILVIGDYVYFDGGNINWHNGTRQDWLKINTTSSISLTSSWTNSTVRFQEVPRPGPPRDSDLMTWVDKEKGAFYVWDVDANGPERINSQLWIFTANNSGGGSWSVKPPQDPTVFNKIYRGKERAFTTCGDMGFALSGFSSWVYDSRLEAILDKDTLLPGFLMYNMTTAVWANESIDAFPYIPSQGKASCLPHIGDKGLLVFYGTKRSIRDEYTAGTDDAFSTFREVALYDISQKKWFWQYTTGDVPPQLTKFCSVGVRGRNNTFEIFVFGGQLENAPTEPSTAIGDIWILSLPAFHWFKLDGKTTPRTFHSCAVIGKRQMLVLGGRGQLLRDQLMAREQWEKGIGIFDLTDLTWSDGYDADAAQYDTPKIVNEHYSKGSSVPWGDETLSGLFAVKNTAPPESSSSGQSPGSTDPLDAKTTTAASCDQGLVGKDCITGDTTATPVGAIVGGTIGGLALVALCVGSFLFWRRLKRAHIPEKPTESQQWQKPELASEGKEPALPASEIDSTPVGELPGSSPLFREDRTTMKYGRVVARHAGRLQDNDRQTGQWNKLCPCLSGCLSATTCPTFKVCQAEPESHVKC